MNEGDAMCARCRRRSCVRLDDVTPGLPSALQETGTGSVHVDHHLQNDRPVSSCANIFFQAHASVETRDPFRLTPQWTSSAEA
ncbi:hypothetical protein [Candidatus Accumulibacter sp. ACC003]|uniref:hypothetical protein n=1 Tax=Candidatus Accumulibacter sp. ACC003 TaxID=2823334 RepID=UPI0025B7CADB|nr:hypothetical protein [Candidatus Accumulibacter sp. ACC003]